MGLKIDRQKVFDKYQGHCAYCGEDITIKNFQVDHIFPKCRSHMLPEFDENRIGNLNPSCRKCNNYKSGFLLEAFRREISLQVERLNKSAQFQRAVRFEQVVINEKPIVFYFERF